MQVAVVGPWASMVTPALERAGHRVGGLGPRCDALVDLGLLAGRRSVLAAARAAGVRQVVHAGPAWLYADQGHRWVRESSPVCVTAATEPACEAELAVQEFASCVRTGVVLRVGHVLTVPGVLRRLLRGAAEDFVPLLHEADLGAAVLAALDAPSGLYNVAAEPARRADLAALAGRAVRQPRAWAARLRPERGAEPLQRSLRVSSSYFTATTGWVPRHAMLDESWLRAGGHPALVLR